MNFAYFRISTDKQDFDRQLYIIKNSGYNIPERNIFCDTKSGKNLDRENYQLLKKIVRNGDTIVFTELSRFSRRYSEISEELIFFQKNNVKTVFLDLPFLNNSEDLTSELIRDITIKLFAYIAEMERINTNTRIKQKLDSLKSQGVQLGRPKIVLNNEQEYILIRYIKKEAGFKPAKETAFDMGININTFYKFVRIYREKYNLPKLTDRAK